MLKRLKACLWDFWLDLVLSWHAVRADRLRENQEPYYRPVHRISSEPLRPDGSPICPVAAHCVNCGHRGSVLMSDGAEPLDVEDEILDMLECPVCGLYTMCSD
jgi:hypothetical protein